MDWDLFAMVSIMFGTAVYLLLDKSLLHVVMGVVVLSNSVNLLLMLTSGDPVGKSAPILNGSEHLPVVDPLPQALVLTSIVISFGLISFFAVVVYLLCNQSGTDDLDQLFRRRK